MLSPGTARFDRGRRRALYARFGVREYWIVDPRARTVQVLDLADGAFDERAVSQVADRIESRVVAGFDAPTRELFAGLDRWQRLR